MSQAPPPPPVAPQRAKLLQSAEGTSAEAFAAADWARLLSLAAIWGSSFMFIRIGLDAFPPTVIAFIRVALGALTLAFFPKARNAVIERDDRLRIALIGVTWIGIPMMLFPIAEQWVSSSLAGMVNGAVPLSSAFFASLFLRRLPGRRQAGGLLVGFVGLLMVTYPAVSGSTAKAQGVALLVLAILLYGVSLNLTVPLQQKYGSVAVVLRAQVVALVLIAPFAAVAAPDTTFKLGPTLAMIPLGTLSTGLAFVLMTGLVGKVGAARAGVAIYFTPIFAIILGFVFLAERLAPLSIAGMAVVLAGAWLSSGREKRRAVST